MSRRAVHVGALILIACARVSVTAPVRRLICFPVVVGCVTTASICVALHSGTHPLFQPSALGIRQYPITCMRSGAAGKHPGDILATRPFTDDTLTRPRVWVRTQFRGTSARGSHCISTHNTHTVVLNRTLVFPRY